MFAVTGNLIIPKKRDEECRRIDFGFFIRPSNVSVDDAMSRHCGLRIPEGAWGDINQIPCSNHANLISLV